MISASEFRLETVDSRLMASCKLTGPGLPKRLWFMAESDDENALDIAEPNWAAVALLVPSYGAQSRPIYRSRYITPFAT